MTEWQIVIFYDFIESIKLFTYSIQLNTKFVLLINVKMPTIVGIVTVICKINTASESIKARKMCTFQHSFYDQSKFHARLS